MNINAIGKDCCGCRSCEQSCPKKCITMVENEEGFIYPKIDSSLCADCGICLKKCPINNYEFKEQNSKVYALANKNKDELLKSASGGASLLAMKKIIEQKNGVVYGVAYNSDFVAQTIRVDNVDDLGKIQSSKYVFADTSNSFTTVKKNLEAGTYVLFSGTSCQVDGLLNFLEKKYDNLFTISLICHGTPSPKLFKEYLTYVEKQNNSKIVDYNHRFKIKGTTGYGEHIKFENGKELLRSFQLTPYGNDFMRCNASRMNCYTCKYCNTSRVGDWSIGDFWGIEVSHKEFDSKGGHSLVMVCTTKGEELFELIKDDVNYLESDIEKAKYGQEHLKRPSKKPEIRDTYYVQFNNDPDFFKHRTPKKTIKYYIKKICPRWVKNFAKTILKKQNKDLCFDDVKAKCIY